MQLYVGNVDAGIATLVSADHIVVRVPTFLLPPDAAVVGCVVDLIVQRNHEAEKVEIEEFIAFQDKQLQEYGETDFDAPLLHVDCLSSTSASISWSNGTYSGVSNGFQNPIVHLFVDNGQVFDSRMLEDNLDLPPAGVKSAAELAHEGTYILEDLKPNTVYSVLMRVQEGDRCAESSLVFSTLAVPHAVPLPASPEEVYVEDESLGRDDSFTDVAL